MFPDPSILQIRQALTEYAVLPLGSQYIHERSPYVKSMLLYGAEKTGKTLLTHVSGEGAWDLRQLRLREEGSRGGHRSPQWKQQLRLVLALMPRLFSFYHSSLPPSLPLSLLSRLWPI